MPQVGFLELLRTNRNVRWLWAGAVVSLFGDWFNPLALYRVVQDLSSEGSVLGDGYVALDPVMIFTPGNGRDGSRETFSETLQTGTRLNFFIGVDKNCSEEGVYAATYDASVYDHSHYALNDYEPYVTGTEESIWAMVEQHPTDDQRWRIGWEDQRRTEWDDPDLTKARSSSLQKTKIEGYDGDGWPTTNAEGYRALRDYGSRPDFSDQVVEATLTPLPGAPGEEPA